MAGSSSFEKCDCKKHRRDVVMDLHKDGNSKNCGGRQRQLKYVRVNAGISETDRNNSEILYSLSSRREFID